MYHQSRIALLATRHRAPSLLSMFSPAEAAPTGSKPLRGREQLPASRPECYPALLRRRMIDRQFDLDPLAFAAAFQFDAPGARDASAGLDPAGDAAATAIEQFAI